MQVVCLPGLRHDDAHLPVDLSEADAAHEGAVGGEVVHHVRHVVVGGVGVLSPLRSRQSQMVGIPPLFCLLIFQITL